MDIFEQASKVGLRFTTPKGLLITEDLWHLPLRSETGRANLNEIAKALNKNIRENEEEDFVEVPGKHSAKSQDSLALDIVKRVIEVKQAENAALAVTAERKEQKQTLLALLAQKKTESLGTLSMEEIEKKIAEL